MNDMATMSIGAVATVSAKPSKKLLHLEWSDIKWPLYFLLSMALMGLRFPLGYLLVPVVMINRFKNDRYDFIIMMTIFFGGCGFIAEGVLPVKAEDIMLLLSVGMACVYRKSRIVKKTLLLLVAYGAILLLIASFSTESMAVQLRTWRYYLLIIYFIVPMAVFADESFDMEVMFRKLFPYILIVCAFYILDGFIMCGFVFLPNTPVDGETGRSTFYSLYAQPLSMIFVRKYPQGLVLMALCIYPLAKRYMLTRWQWVLVLGACVASQTFTVISGFIVGYILCNVTRRNALKYVAASIAGLCVLYYIDGLLPEVKTDEGMQSSLRMKSSIDQILFIQDMQDDEDLAKLASGRSGQILPKIELVSSLGKELIGLGFLHPKLTTNTDYIIDNEYYLDISQSVEVATGIECEPFQVYVSVGILGLLAYIGFYVMLNVWLYRQRYRYALYFTSVNVMVFWFSLGAYGGLTNAPGLTLVSLAYATVLMAGKAEESHVDV